MAKVKEKKSEIQVEKGKMGGARPGAGRPIGVSNKFKIADQFSQEQKENLVKQAYDLALGGDSKMVAYLLDQMCGKARQNIGLDGGEDGSAILIDGEIKGLISNKLKDLI